MCAIIGASGRNSPALKAAAQTIRYRGPDATEFYESDAFSLGHHRLSIIDLDPRANQPMANERGNIRIVFNGEIYNFKELRSELEFVRPFHTTSDTEVILRGYEKWGIDVVKKLKGMFALAILDEAKRKVFLARDHAGIKPLYYYQNGGELVFASEVKAVAKYLREIGKPLEIDREAVGLFLAFGYVPAPQTILKHILRLPAATIAEFDLVSHSFLLSPFDTEVRHVLPAELETLVEEKILKHLVADVPIGLFFSGGTDSSLIAAVLHKHNADLSTWSIRLPGKQDAKAFEGISAQLNLKSQIAEFGPKELDAVFEEVLSRLDEPLADNSIFPTYFVSKLAAKKVKIVLSGEGGDEYFLGYPRMRVLGGLRRVSAKLGLVDRLFYVTPDFPGKNRFFLMLFEKAGDAVGYYLLAMSPGRNLVPKEVWAEARRIVADVQDPLSFDAKLYLENDLLRKTDLATMYNSIEGRVPFLDPDVIALARRISPVEHFADGTTKAVLKHMLARLVPREFVYRGKSGFGMDLRHFWTASEKLGPALQEAEASLARHGVILPLEAGWAQYTERYPNFVFGLITLARSIDNLLC